MENAESTLFELDRLVRQRYAQYICSARKRGLSFYLTLKEFRDLICKPCFYCGTEKSNSARSQYFKEVVLTYNGIDRYFPDIGYTKNNSVTCCFQCNEAKRAKSPEQFTDWIERLGQNALQLREKVNKMPSKKEAGKPGRTKIDLVREPSLKKTKRLMEKEKRIEQKRIDQERRDDEKRKEILRRKLEEHGQEGQKSVVVQLTDTARRHYCR